MVSPNRPNDVGPAFGRVDELDDPRPGHLSDGPTPISSTTTITTSLQDRFVRGEDNEKNDVRGGTRAPEEVGNKDAGIRAESPGEQDADETMSEEKIDVADQEKDKGAGSEGGEDKENQV